MCATLCALGPTKARAEVQLSYAQALDFAKRRAPDLAVARANETVAEADSRVAGIYPNPSLNVGTNTQAARLTFGATVPLLILGQRGAAIDAGRAEFAVAKLSTRVTQADARAATAHAFVALWLAERIARARNDATDVARRLDTAAGTRVELGSSAAVDGLRAHAESLRVELDARAASAAVAVAGTTLAALLGASLNEPLASSGDPDIPEKVPSLAELAARVPNNPGVLQALAEEQASQRRLESERAQLRPAFALDVGVELYDPTTPTNYRAQLGFEVPLFNQRGPLIERERRRAHAARLLAHAERVRLEAALVSAMRNFAILSERTKTLRDGVLPAAARAARASEESYTLGRAPLIDVLDAERARIDAELALVDSQAARADAWIDVERALGVE